MGEAKNSFICLIKNIKKIRFSSNYNVLRLKETMLSASVGLHVARRVATQYTARCFSASTIKLSDHPSVAETAIGREYTHPRIGDREIVGWGQTGAEIYIDREDKPYPAIRWKEGVGGLEGHDVRGKERTLPGIVLPDTGRIYVERQGPLEKSPRDRPHGLGCFVMVLVLEPAVRQRQPAQFSGQGGNAASHQIRDRLPLQPYSRHLQQMGLREGPMERINRRWEEY